MSSSLTSPRSVSNSIAGSFCCPDCGSLLDGYADKFARQDEELNRLHTEVKKLRAQVAADRSEMTAQDKVAYESWLAAHGKDASKAKNRWGPGMQSSLRRARKAGLKQDEILKAIGAHARYPFLVFGRWAATGAPRDRKDSLSDLFKNEDRWGAMLELSDAPPPTTHDRRSGVRYTPSEHDQNLTLPPRREQPIDAFLSALERANCLPHVASNGQGTARCPAHDDTFKSLSFKEREDGTLLCNCHAGCGGAQIVEALGLQLRDLFPPNQRSH